jgi:hypothetical protein
MSSILRLEYACTHAEMNQAQSLVMRKQLGGGSKWRTWLLLFLVLVGMLAGFYFQFRDIPPIFRVLILASAVGGGILVVFFERKFRKRARATNKVEISATDFTFLGPGAKVAMPWSAFSECLESADIFVLLDRPKRTLFVVPKRAFQNENSQTWFRELVNNGLSVHPPDFSQSSVLGTEPIEDLIKFTVKLRFRDYLDATLASWFIWGIIVVTGVLIATVTFLPSDEPPQNPVFSTTEVFLMFMLPFYFVVAITILLIFSFHAWFSRAKYSDPEEFAFSEESISFAGLAASGTFPWTNLTHYKETWSSFILWRGSSWRSSAYMILPKRAFASWDDVSRCRNLLDRHLRRSRWFRG